MKRAAKRVVPFEFVLDALAPLEPWTRPFFGCTAVYVEEKIVLILREKGDPQDDGVWVDTRIEHHASLRREMPSLRSIVLFGPGETNWQVLPAAEDGFEREVARACALVRRGDPRIGHVPERKKKRRRGPR
jgi:hypothetical protein